MNLTTIENHFLQQQKLLGNLADEESLQMIFDLIDTVRLLDQQADRLTSLNRHYLFRFYGGDVLKMQEDFGYLNEQ